MPSISDSINIHAYGSLRYQIINVANVIVSNEGIEVTTPDGVFRSRGMLLELSTDLPARAFVCNMKIFKGKH